MTQTKRNSILVVLMICMALLAFSGTALATEIPGGENIPILPGPETGTGSAVVLRGDNPISSGDPGKWVKLDIYLEYNSASGWDNVRDIRITPEVSTDPSIWPFEIDHSNHTQTLTLKGRSGHVTYDFLISEKVPAGTHPLTFNLSYTVSNTLNGQTITQLVKETITVYVHVNKDGRLAESNKNNDGPLVLSSDRKSVV